MTAIFKNGGGEGGTISKMVFFISLSHKTNPHTICIAIDETVIKISGNKIWQPFSKWPLNHYGTK